MTPLPRPALASACVAFAVLAVATRGGSRAVDALQPSAGVSIRRATLVRRVGSVPALARVAGAGGLRSLLGSSGSSRDVEDVVGAKVLLAVAGTAVGLLLSGSLVASIALGLVAFRAPDARLARAARLRKARADRELPVLLDLLAAAAVAGLTGQLAVRRAAEATEGPLAEELATAFRRVDLGGRWREELGAAADRLDLPDLRRAVTVLTRSDTIGSSLAEAVSELARESREARRSAVAERARKAPVKMLFPLVFLVLPAFLLLTVVPVLVTTLQSIR